MKVSVVIPIFNERATLRLVIERVLAVPLEMELLCVDDGSTDGSREMDDGVGPGDDQHHRGRPAEELLVHGGLLNFSVRQSQSKCRESDGGGRRPHEPLRLEGVFRGAVNT